MDISELFKDLHGAITKKDLILYKTVNPENAKEIADFIKLDIGHLYYYPNGKLYNIMYWDDIYFQQFTGEPVSEEVMVFMQEDKKFLQCKSVFDKLRAEKNYRSLFARIDKKVIIETYNNIYEEIPIEDVYDIFVDIYQRSEFNFHLFNPDVVEAAISNRSYSKAWKGRMDELVQKADSEGNITLYRGEGDPTGEFYSWTFSKKVALFFATRFGAKGKILKETISIDRAIDYLTSRGEEEVLIMPE
jgi:hypothetical protein